MSNLHGYKVSNELTEFLHQNSHGNQDYAQDQQISSLTNSVTEDTSIERLPQEPFNQTHTFFLSNRDLVLEATKRICNQVLVI